MNSINSLKENEKLTKSNEEIINSLKNIFWENIKKWIEKEVKNSWIIWLEKLNKKIAWQFVSSCFHPNEFWIWSYRPTSLINILELSEEIWLWAEVEYLDTLSSKSYWLKGFPNLQTWKSKPTISKKIVEIAEKNQNPRELLKQKDEIFENILKNSLENRNLTSENTNYLKNILKELKIFDEINDFLEEKNYNENQKNNFLSFLLKENILSALEEIKNIFSKKILNEKYKWKITQNEVFAEFQNAVLTVLFQKNFPEYIELLKKNWLYDKNWLNLKISYNNKENTQKYSESFEIILNEKDLWEDFFMQYFDDLIKRSNWREVEFFSYWEDWKENEVLIYKENDEIKFKIKNWKNVEEIEKKDFFEKLTKNNQKINFSGVALLFLACLSGKPHIGSERWIREIVASSLENHFKNKNIFDENKENYIKKVIFWLNIFDTFVENEENWEKKLAGSCWSFPSDMVKMVFIWWDFAKDQLKNAKNDNSKIPKINQELLLKSLEKCVKSSYKKIQNLEKNDKKQDFLKEFFELNEKYSNSKDLKDFLNLVNFCFNLEKYL